MSKKKRLKSIIDYRKLKEIIITDSTLLSLIDNTIN